MKSRRSLRLRLLGLGLGVLAASLLVAGVSLSALFGRHLERRAGQELDTQIETLTGTLRITPEGALSLSREPADPRFAQPLGGFYWQIDDVTGGGHLASRSLWDAALPPAGDLAPGTELTRDVAGPGGTVLLLHERGVVVPVGASDHRIRIAVAIDRAELDALAMGFARDAGYVLAALGLVLATGLWLQIVAGLQPLAALAAGVSRVRGGADARLSPQVPREIEPLVAEMNSLLDAQEREMVRARDRAADLAHGLKTPLTSIAADIRLLRQRGDGEIADNLENAADTMRRHVERELARTRIRHGSSHAMSAVPVAVRRVLRVVERVPDAEGKRFLVDVADGFMLPMGEDDLTEALGNLLDNAARHARRTVRVTAGKGGEGAWLQVEDDGPGIAESAIGSVLERGGRLDRRGGAGLGLAIVGDVVEAYGGRLELGRSSLGGLSARVSMPS